MAEPKPLPPAVRVYVVAVSLAGGLAIAWSAAELVQRPVGLTWLVLLLLTSFSSSFAIRIPNVSATISVSETFVFVCALLYGPAPATIVVAVDGLVISFRNRNRRPDQILFNATAPALSLFVATHAFFMASGLDPAHGRPIDVGRSLIPLTLFTFTYFLINSGLTSAVVALQRGSSLWAIWWQHFGSVLLNYCGAASVAALIVHRSSDLNVVALAVVVPLMIISYLTFKTSLARYEDTTRHLQELNRLYLSTIETLAMAVDAKDQITHGHIRRVQTWAVGLARALGIREDGQIKAIEAAALLHDMGKLAIPEHILNKPGKLTKYEFDQMKKHVTIGAEMLSAIKFPYPVVPIVRHHHEQWDGTGYPDGLAGADIPIGARILSVVDVFDALTSDRPYRRALSDETALAMLLEGRGKAHDPLVVDTFIRVYKDIAPVEVDDTHRRTLDEIAAVAQSESSPATPDGSTPAAPRGADPEVLPIYRSLHAFSAQAVLADAIEDVARHLTGLTPASLVALYEHDASTGALTVAHASGDGAAYLRGARLAVGERLSGWAAANRQTVCNSDAALDLGDLPDPPPRSFRSCLSVPLVVGDALVGVLTLYAAERQAFSDLHRRVVEHVAQPLAHLVCGALELEKVEAATSPAALASLPSADEAGAASMTAHPDTGPVATVSLQLTGLLEGPRAEAAAQDLLLARAAAVLRRELRAADLLYRDGPGGLLAVLAHADADSAQRIADRARGTLRTALGRLDGAVADGTRIRAGVAAAPADGVIVDDLIEVARARAASAGDGPPAESSLLVLPEPVAVRQEPPAPAVAPSVRKIS